MVQLTISSPATREGVTNPEAWLQQLAAQYSIENIPLLRQAISLAQIAGSDRATPNGESCLNQGISMVEILAELNLDPETLAAAMIYSCVCYAGLNLEDVTEQINEKVSRLVKGTLQMEAVNLLRGEHYHSHDPGSIDNIRKMLLAMVDDVSVVLLKLAERLCILRNIAIFNDAKKRQVAKETMDIYAPLANRLGIGQLKWQLEDLSFRYLQPDAYKKISAALNERRLDRESYIKQFMGELNDVLREAEVQNFQISGRAKHIYSIHKKMMRKNLPIQEIYDISAMRILVPTVADCYTALSSVHARWTHIQKEFDDYIATPKPNGYRSIHTAVIGSNDKPIEIQIRTTKMHEEAELGVAAHWLYKEGIGKPSSYEEKILWLRQVLDWQKEIAKTDAAKADIQTELFDDRVYVFTPNGAVLDLMKGATPLDFAYHIHSELGHRCRGAKANGHIVPLIYALKTGDRIEILTIKEGHPSRDWMNPHLGYLKTARAKAKVAQWFKKQDYERHLADGKNLIEKELKRLHNKEANLEQIALKLNYKTGDDLLAALGRGEIGVNAIVSNSPVPEETQHIAKIKTGLLKQKISDVFTKIDVEGVGNLLIHLALCCNPEPGEAIIGYVTRTHGITIHREDCANITRAQTIHDEKIISVNWK
jgi:GTP pyrophosphokinase